MRHALFKEVMHLQGPLVLVVEDDVAIIELFRLLLEQEGYRVEAAQDGLEALDMLKNSPPDLVILDLRLPKLEGLDVLREMRSDTILKSVPVVIVSVDDSPQAMLRGWQLGVDGYFVKPFDPEELLRLIRHILSLPCSEALLNA